MIKGSLVALVTPFDVEGNVDYQSLEHLVSWHLQSKTEGIVVLGTTGEAATLSAKEKDLIVANVIAQVNGKVPVIVGSGSNCTKTTMLQTSKFHEMGADACLVVTPYYNRPTQKGLYKHYKLVAETGAKIILYNVTPRTGCDLSPDTVKELAELENIIGIKEGVGDEKRFQALLAIKPDDFVVLSGQDDANLKLLKLGGHGVISVTANIAPRIMQKMVEAGLAGNFEVSAVCDKVLKEWHTSLFVESNPIPTKWLLYKMRLIKTPYLRMPLTTLDKKYHAMFDLLLADFMGVTNRVFA
jgi:4-hydroxy-tetrahydrodipicolinate synthase